MGKNKRAITPVTAVIAAAIFNTGTIRDVSPFPAIAARPVQTDVAGDG